MSDALIVYKGRTNIVPVSLGIDVAGDVITSEIRAADNTLIATWSVAYENTGSDGELILTLDNTITAAITQEQGLMDIKRVSAGEPYSVFEAPIEVQFKGIVTQ